MSSNYRPPQTLHLTDPPLKYDEVEYYFSMSASNTSIRITHPGDESLPLLLSPLLFYCPLLLLGLWCFFSSRVVTRLVPWNIAGLFSLLPALPYFSATFMVLATTFEPQVISAAELSTSAFSFYSFMHLLSAPGCRLTATFYYYPKDYAEGTLAKIMAAEHHHLPCVPVAAAGAAATALLVAVLLVGACARLEERSCR